MGTAPGVTGCTLANWQSGTGQDANSISVDPLFINPNGNAATVNLHISAREPLRWRSHAGQRDLNRL